MTLLKAARLRRALVYELFLAGRFTIVGVAATGVHMSAVWALIEWRGIAPLPANFLAFLTAFALSFAGHYLWTFGAPGDALRALFRLLLVSALAFAFNTVILAYLLQKGWMIPATAAVLAASFVPLVTLLVSRLWVFRPARQTQVQEGRAQGSTSFDSKSAS